MLPNSRFVKLFFGLILDLTFISYELGGGRYVDNDSWHSNPEYFGQFMKWYVSFIDWINVHQVQGGRKPLYAMQTRASQIC